MIVQIYFNRSDKILYQHWDLNPLPSDLYLIARALPSLQGSQASVGSQYFGEPSRSHKNHYFSH